MTMLIIMWTLKLLDTELYSESIAGTGIARLISWLGTAGPVYCFNRVFGCYIRVYRSSSIFICRVQPIFWLGPPLATSLK